MCDTTETTLQNINNDIINKKNANKLKLSVIDQVIEMFPQLKKDQTNIVNNILGHKEINNDYYILDKFVYNDKVYYRDPYCHIIDTELNVVGIYNYENDNYKYYFHSIKCKYNIKNIDKFVI
jgi:hypothetical protein